MTSPASPSQQPWFVQRRLSRHNPFHDGVIWAAPGPAGGPRTNWDTGFSGTVWTFNPPAGADDPHLFRPGNPT